MNNIDLNALRDRAYKIACEHGFHDEELSNEHSLMLVITELAEAVEADRKGAYCSSRISSTERYNLFPTEESRFKKEFSAFVKDTVEDELADAVIRILDLCGLCELKAYTVPMELFPDCYTLTEHLYRVCSVLADWKNRIGNADLGFQLSQAISYLFAYCERYDIDLLWHIEQKMKYNELRDKMHGKKY